MRLGSTEKHGLRPVCRAVAVWATFGCVAPNPAFEAPPPDIDASGERQGRLISGAAGMNGQGGQRDVPSGRGGGSADAGGTRPPRAENDAAPIIPAVDVALPLGPVCPAWWKKEFTRRISLPVPGGARGLPAGSFVSHTFDHAALVARTISKTDGRDVHIGFWNGSAWVEVPFFVDERSKWNATTTRVWWRLSAAVSPAATATEHYLFFGDPAAPAVIATKPLRCSGGSRQAP